MLKEKVLIVNDIAGIGKVASNIVFPLLNAGGLDSVILPTLLLSSNTEAEEIVTLSTNEIFDRFLKAWDDLDYHFDSIVTGYFAEISQIDTVSETFKKMKENNPNAKLYVDPTMGDNGHLYSVFNEEVPKHFSDLVALSDLVKPNITEACLMTGHPYSEDMSFEELTDLAKKVHNLGAKNTILTGVRKDGKIGFLYYDENDETGIILHKYFDHHFFGTGDIVFSLITIFHQHGFSIKESLEETSLLTEKALAYTLERQEDDKYGVFYQEIIPELNKLLKKY